MDLELGSIYGNGCWQCIRSLKLVEVQDLIVAVMGERPNGFCSCPSAEPMATNITDSDNALVSCG